MDSKLCSALKSLISMRHNNEFVQVIETHISVLFLTQKWVYKIKKNIKLSFADYSSLQRRYYYIREELRLNRRLAPHIYKRPIAIFKDEKGELTWEKTKTLFEWALLMVRLPDSLMVDQMILKGYGDRINIQSLALILKAFYKKQRYSVEIDAEKFHLNLKAHCLDNYVDLSKIYLKNSIHELFQAAVGAQISFLLREKNLFLDRTNNGYVIEGHGDLKPEHICMTEPPNIFDCIEFSSQYRMVDIIDELAFFALESEFLGQKNIGDKLLTEMINSTKKNYQLISFYKSYRALVRAKVETFKQSQLQDYRTKEIEHYIRLAYKYADHIAKPLLIIVSGYSGSGKTLLAKKLQDILCARYLSTDKLRSECYETPSHKTHEFSEGKYSSENRDLIYQILFKEAECSIKSRLNVIIDGSFVSKKYRDQAKNLLKESVSQPCFVGIWCECPDSIAKKRVANRLKHKSDFSEAYPDLLDLQKSHSDNIEKDEGFIVVNTNNRPEKTLEKAVGLISEKVRNI